VEGGAEGSAGALAIRRFVEKPDRDTPRLPAAGNSSGTAACLLRASVMLEEFRVHQAAAAPDAAGDLCSDRPIAREDYQRLTDISIDYAVMEKTARA